MRKYLESLDVVRIIMDLSTVPMFVGITMPVEDVPWWYPLWNLLCSVFRWHSSYIGY